MDTVKVTFNLPHDLFVAFKQVSESEGRSMTWYLTSAVRQVVEKRVGELVELEPVKVQKKSRRSSRKKS